MKYDIYGIGNALVDYLALVTDAFLIEKQVRKGYMTLVDLPGAEKTLIDNPEGFERVSGGSAANTVVGVANLGGKAGYTGKVASDENGEFYRQNLNDAGVDFFSSPFGKGTTGTCVSLVTPDGQRSMLTYLGISSELSRADINEDAIADARYLYVEGYQWSSEDARDASVYAMELAKKHGTSVSFTYSDPFMVETYGTEFRKITEEFVDLLFCNEDEATILTGKESGAEAISDLREMCERVCVTTGADGALVTENGGSRSVPAVPVDKVVDTTGAGDMYAAGVIRGLCAGRSLEDASKIGARMAAMIISQIGARLSGKFELNEM